MFCKFFTDCECFSFFQNKIIIKKLWTLKSFIRGTRVFLLYHTLILANNVVLKRLDDVQFEMGNLNSYKVYIGRVIRPFIGNCKAWTTDISKAQCYIYSYFQAYLRWRLKWHTCLNFSILQISGNWMYISKSFLRGRLSLTNM